VKNQDLTVLQDYNFARNVSEELVINPLLTIQTVIPDLTHKQEWANVPFTVA
jgi:hypothetical protein